MNVSSNVTRIASVSLVLAAVAFVRPAQAAPPAATNRPATDGVDRLYHDYSGEGDASSIELNPAMLAASRGLDLTLLGYQTTSPYTRGSGFGGFASATLGFGIATGFGIQNVRPLLGEEVFDFAADRNPAFTKVSWALAAGLGEYGAFGFGIHGIRNDGRWLQRPDIDLGLMARILNYGSVGLVGRLSPADLRSENLPSEFSLVGEVALRPLGTHNFEIAGGLKSRLMQAEPGEPLRNRGVAGLLGRGRIAVRYHGLAVLGEVEQVNVDVLDSQTLLPLRGDKAVRGSIALQAAWDFVSVQGGVHAGVSDGVDGWGIKARLSTHRQGRVFWARPVEAERLELGGVTSQRELVELLARIERARRAGKRSVLVVDARGADLGWASLHELRQALIGVRNAGGHVFAYLEQSTLADYYLASVAEKVFIHPAGSLDTYGIASSGLYFGEALGRLGVRAEVLKIDEYKSAGEPFSRDAPSEPDRRQRAELLRDLYAQVTYDVAQARGLGVDEVKARFDAAPLGPADAVQEKLVDAVVHRDELIEEISAHLGANVTFRALEDTSPAGKTWSRAPYIAVVLVEGTIVDGESRFIPFFDLKFAGGDTIAATLRDLRQDPSCRGIVVRVDSPGGSALASDVIWREVERTASQHDKNGRRSPPIVVSMSDLAASGGYYVAMGAKQVFADPMTITGSIGVISIHIDLSGLLQKLGISAATFKEGKNPDINSPFKAYTADQRTRIETSIRQTYDLFRERVARGRGITKERVHELGRGHVYSGIDAKALGLVDTHGGLYDAIAWLRREAGVAKVRELELRILPRRPRLVDLILEQLGNPFSDRGAVGRALTRRRARMRAEATRATLPLALDQALAKLPLSVLYLPQDRAQAIVPWLLEPPR